MARCKDCIHFGICKKGFPWADGNGGGWCENFIPANVAPADELIEAVKKIICENTYPSFDHNGKPVNVWKAREGYDALDALKEKYKEV